jgi:hypothetical protein
MQAHVGDRLVVRGHAVGMANRDGKILEVRGNDGEPPFVVEWTQDGQVGLVRPGPDAVVQHVACEQAQPR